MKKIISALIAVVLTAGIMSGCGEEYYVSNAVYPETAEYPSDEWFDDLTQRDDLRKKVSSDKINEFNKNIAKEFLTENENQNTVVSPLNIYIALSVLAETTDNNSRNQILTLLNEDSIESLRESAYNLWISNYRDDGVVTSVFANSLWLNENYKYNKETEDFISKQYFADIYTGNMTSANFLDLLKGWLNDKTRGLLKDNVDSIQLEDDTVMALYSTVYFSSSWQENFNAENNDEKIFHSPENDIKTTFMNGRNESGLYYTSDDFGAITLNFTTGGWMNLILPNEDKSVADVLSNNLYLEIGNNSESAKLEYVILNYSVPKFDISSEISLNDGLSSLGVTDIFDSDVSDFSALTDNENVFVSKTRHAARVKIDEEGVEAAAFTEILEEAADAALEKKEIDFILDRPFIFVIYSDVGDPLFIGTVYEVQ